MNDESLGVSPSGGEWRQVPGFSRYSVSDAGEVRGRFGRPMRTETLKGYITFKAWSDEGRRIRVGVHQLVALAFVGPRPTPRHEAAHWDGSRSNNSAGNIRWATPEENSRDKLRHGTYAPESRRGEGHPMVKLSDAQVAEIRARYTATPGQLAELAREFSVHRNTIWHIANGKERRT